MEKGEISKEAAPLFPFQIEPINFESLSLPPTPVPSVERKVKGQKKRDVSDGCPKGV